MRIFLRHQVWLMGLILCACGCQTSMISSPLEFIQPEANFPKRLSSVRLIEQQGELLRAEQEYQKLSRKYPHRYEVHQRMGILAQRRGESQQAIEHLQQARHRAPMNANVLGDLGYALYLAGRYDEAVEILQQGQQINPSHQRIQSNLAMALIACQQVPSAMALLRQHADEAAANTSVGFALAQHGRIEEARRHFELAIDLNPHHQAAAEALVQLLQRSTGPSSQVSKPSEYVPSEKIAMYRPSESAPTQLGRSPLPVRSPDEPLRPSLDRLVEQPSAMAYTIQRGPAPPGEHQPIEDRVSPVLERVEYVAGSRSPGASPSTERISRLLHSANGTESPIGTWETLSSPLEADEPRSFAESDSVEILDSAPRESDRDRLMIQCRNPHASWPERIDAAASLAIMEPDQGVGQLVLLLTEAPHVERTRLWKHLGTDPATASSFGPALLNAFGGTQGSERIEAALTISRIFGWYDFAIEAIAPLTKSPDDSVREHARTTLLFLQN